jgi:hypothetical protein
MRFIIARLAVSKIPVPDQLYKTIALLAPSTARIKGAWRFAADYTLREVVRAALFRPNEIAAVTWASRSEQTT